MDHLVADNLESLHPTLTLFATPEKAYEAALVLERQFGENVGEGASHDEESEEEKEMRR